MSFWTDSLLALCLLAADEAPAQPQGDPMTNMMLQVFVPMMVIYFIFMFFFGPHKREQRKRQELLKAMKKNDRVETIGGIIGTVASIDAEANEVSLKVDNNTRIKMRLAAIQRITTPESTEDSS